MELLRCKARLSVLWLTMFAGTVSSMFLGLLTPGTIKEVMGGTWGGEELSEGILTMYAFFFIIPAVLAILSLTLNGSANRWLNFILGIIWVLGLIFELVREATGEMPMYIASYLMFAAAIIIAAFIAWFAWKLPKQEA
jgi:hypothetical protein